MEEYFKEFVREEMYLDVVREMPDADIEKVFPKLNLPIGHQLRVKKAIADVKKHVPPQEAPHPTKRDSSEISLIDLPTHLFQIKVSLLSFILCCIVLFCLLNGVNI
jgi:hypothetical protein